MATVIGPNAVSPENLQSGAAGSDVVSFINFLGDERTQIPLDSNFLLSFDNIPPAMNAPFPTGYENNWNIENTRAALTGLLETTNGVSNGGKGCMFVQAFDIPGESVATERVSTVVGGPSLGLLSRVVSKERVQYNSTFDVAILETNKSFTDFVIRPWISLVGHYGLITRKPDSLQNVRTNITGILFDRNNKNKARKVYRFTGCAPVSLGVINYAYGNNDARRDKVSFVFNKFSISDQEGTSR